MHRLWLLLLLLGLLLPPAPSTAQHRLSGRVFPADSLSPAGVWVFARTESGVDSAAVDAEGRFSLEVGAGTLELSTDEMPGAPRRYHPALLRLRAEERAEEPRIVLVPHRWSIRSGVFAGRSVEISMRRAFAPACRGCSSFFRLGEAQPPSRRAPAMATWPARAFPLRLAFAREEPVVRVPRRDSLAFWRVVERLEREFGRDLFRPVPYRETLGSGESSPEDVVLVLWDPRLRHVGWGSTFSQVGDIIYGAIRFRGPAVFRDRGATRVIKHELLHTLGVGHTCGWVSVMTDFRQCRGRSADGATREDVAYFELLTAVRDLQRAVGAQFGLESALFGERELPERR